MPPFTKSPPEITARFHAVAPRHPTATLRKMFGYPALFVGGNYATGLFADRWVVRLTDADLAELLSAAGGDPFSPMPGRAMKGWGALPPAVVADDAALDSWIERAIAYASSLPPKG